MTQDGDQIDQIWDGDLLGRREEAELLQRFIKNESDAFLRSGRQSSVVLAIDAEYGQGKSWFLDHLARQLALSHPVARIDAWADDASAEPLSAFMASIEDALAPYLRSSVKLRDRLARLKVAALPVMGRLAKGAIFKGLSKVAGDSAEDALGEAFEGAVQKAKEKGAEEESGISEAVNGVLEEVGKQIDSLVDRRGAAMLAEYRQRRASRQGFRKNMRELVAEIDRSEARGESPLIVIVDELDRCRPDYAIRILEEIKHFFDVPGVVFVLAVHGDQLLASVEAVYGSSFDARSYMLRFFSRKYKMRRLSVSEIVVSYFADWQDQPDFLILDLMEGGSAKTPSVEAYIAALLDEYQVTPREAYPVLDALRLFSSDTGREEKIQLHALIQHIVRLVRGMKSTEALVLTGSTKLASFKAVSQSRREPQSVSLFQLLDRLTVWGEQIGRAKFQEYSHNPADNLAKCIVEAEFSRRLDTTDYDVRSVTHSYPNRVEGIMRLAQNMFPLEKPEGE